MFLKLQNNKMLNMKYLQDVFQGFHDKDIVVFYLVNGTKFIEKYSSEDEALNRVSEVRESMISGGGLIQRDSVADFPEKGGSGTIYIAKDTGQTYYWNSSTQEYVETGTSGRTGVYAYNNSISPTIGAQTEINKSDLTEILSSAVDYMNGSEVIATNNARALIVDSTSTKVSVKTVVDLTIESFKQVATVNDLPATGSYETLYYVKETNKLYSYDDIKNKYISYDNTDQVNTAINNEKTARENADTNLQNTKENSSNKVTSISSSSTDVQYPSAKCVYDNIQTINNQIGNISNALDLINGEVV